MRKIMAGIFILYLFVSSKAHSQWSTYDHESFSIQYSSSWNTKPGKEGTQTIVFFSSEVKDNKVSIVSVGRLNNKDGLTRSEYMTSTADAYKQAAKESKDGSKIKPVKEGSDKNGNYFYIEVTNKETTIIQYFWLEDKQPGLAITFYSSNSLVKANKAILKQMIGSFVIKK